MAEARILASDLMQQRLAACVQISGPGWSTYRWKGEVEQAEESYLDIKTTLAKRDDVIGWLNQHHPYELPEIVCSEYEASDAYANWVKAETS